MKESIPIFLINTERLTIIKMNLDMTRMVRSSAGVHTWSPTGHIRAVPLASSTIYCSAVMACSSGPLFSSYTRAKLRTSPVGANTLGATLMVTIDLARCNCFAMGAKHFFSSW